MKKVVIILIVFFISSPTFSQEIITKKYQSQELQDVRNVSIYLPKSYDTKTDSNFPLAIVLDAENLLDLYIGNASYFAAKDNAPEQIVVGINMKETYLKDVSFNKATSNLTQDSDRFLQFLKNELLPYVEANYRTSPFITITGSGVSGNFITHFLKEPIPIFNAYICLNPMLALDINQQVASYDLKRLEEEDNTFYFYMNSHSFSGKKSNELSSNLGTYLKSLEIKNVHIVSDTLQNSPSVASTIGEAIPRAFSKIFEIYSGISKKEFDDNIKNLSPADAIAYLENKYLEIEFLFGTSMGIRENDIYAIENIILEKENGDYLRDFGEMILKIYPNSPLGDYYIGRYYETGKRYKKALYHYKVGYGKMDPSDPNSDKYYENVLRVVNKR